MRKYCGESIRAVEPRTRGCLWFRLTLVWFLGLSAALPLAAQENGQASQEELFLSLVLNSVAREQVVRVVHENGELYMDADDLRALGLRWEGGDAAAGPVRLGGLPGLSVSYDVALQRLTLLAPAEMLGFPTQSIRPDETPRAMMDPSTRAPGMVLNYDWYVQRQPDGAMSGSVLGGFRLFGVTQGVFDQTVISSRGAQLDEQSWLHVRLDTSWRFDDPDAMTSFTLGDGVSGGLAWTRATRIGGLHYSRNFGLQPYRVVTPLAAFEGMATLPSTVDLYVNGIRRLSQPVAPGAFQIDRVPTVNGSGMAQLLITDITGNSRRIDIPLYGSQSLVQQGLSDWSFDLGQVRRNYGTESFDYAGLASSATWRHGYTSALTLEGHAESYEDMINGGAGAGFLLGRWGLVNLSVAISRFDISDRQLAASYQWTSARWYASASAQKRTTGYEDIGSMNDSPASLSQSTVAAGFNWQGHTFGASLVRQEDAWGHEGRYAMLNYGLPAWGGSSVNISLTKEYGSDGGTSLYASLYVPLGGRVSASTAVQTDESGTSLTASASRLAPVVEGGWGWRVSGTQGGGERESSATAQVSNLNRWGQWQFMTSEVAGQSSQNASGSGSLIWMADRMYARRRVDDAFALVSSNGLPHVEVMRQNQVIGQTDEDGWMFVDRLHGYQRNLLSMSPTSLPPDWVGRKVSVEAVPPAGQGVIVRFEVERVLGVEIPLRDAAGAPLPVASPVWLDAETGRTLVELRDRPATGYVGFDGLLYLENPQPGSSLYVRLPDSGRGGHLCAARLPKWDAGQRGPIQLEPLTCH